MRLLWGGTESFRRGYAVGQAAHHPIVIECQPYLVRQPFKPRADARPNVCLPFATVSSLGCHDRRLTLHTCRPAT